MGGQFEPDSGPIVVGCPVDPVDASVVDGLSVEVGEIVVSRVVVCSVPDVVVCSVMVDESVDGGFVVGDDDPGVVSGVCVALVVSGDIVVSVDSVPVEGAFVVMLGGSVGLFVVRLGVLDSVTVVVVTDSVVVGTLSVVVSGAVVGFDVIDSVVGC